MATVSGVLAARCSSSSATMALMRTTADNFRIRRRECKTLLYTTILPLRLLRSSILLLHWSLIPLDVWKLVLILNLIEARLPLFNPVVLRVLYWNWLRRI